MEELFDRLRMAHSKLKKQCDFFKCGLYYLGHLISGKGIYPLPEKLKSIKDLHIPKMSKEVIQMLGLTG